MAGRHANRSEKSFSELAGRLNRAD